MDIDGKEKGEKGKEKGKLEIEIQVQYNNTTSNDVDASHPPSTPLL